MQSALIAKEILAGDTPLFFFDVELAGGEVLHWSTRTIDWLGNHYEARVLKTSLFESQLTSDAGIGGIPKLSFELANADSAMSQIERQVGFKGGRLTVTLAFVDVAAGQASSDSYVMFRGLINPPDQISESTFRLSAMNRMTMQRASLPDVRIQRLCPWRFPSSPAQRLEAVDGASKGRYSSLFRCGYSPDQQNGVGNLNQGSPFTSCSNTRSDCDQRGMFSTDSAGRQTGRFGGFEFVPASILVRGSGQSSSQVSAVVDNQARYNDFIPLVYGTQWHSPDVVFTRNDGNLTRMEVLLGMGEIEGVVHVLVNGIEIPRGQAGADMTGTGWYNPISYGSKNGTRNNDFADSTGAPLGDPYGSMAYLSVVVPNRISNGTNLPKVQVLTQGLNLYRFDDSGNYLDEVFTDNPAWVLLDVLMRSGFTLDELDKGSFARAAAYAGELIDVNDPLGGSLKLPRFQCNFALKDKRSAGDVIRGIRNSSRLYLVMNAAGLIEARTENSFALQQPVKPGGSNAPSEFNGGWAAYEFDESSIARKSSGTSSVVISSRGSQDTPNRYSIEFQDSLNQYQQDSLSLGSGDDVDLCGHEIATGLDAPGISTFSQAARMVLLALDRSIRGNVWITFETSGKALGLNPGDLITVTYSKEGFSRTAFRVTKVAPGPGFRTASITAQIHDDAWYSDSTDVIAGALGRQPGQASGSPLPVIGTTVDANGNLQLGITEQESIGTDGTARVTLSIAFITSSRTPGSLPAPLIDMAATPLPTGGTLQGGKRYFYSVSALDQHGNEGPRSFLAQANLLDGNTNSILLTGIRLPLGAGSYHVYRGQDPRQLLRIASNVTPSQEFTDTGLAVVAAGPADPLFDHANAYWRWELLPECQVTGHTPNSISNSGLRLSANAYAGSRVIVTRGTGERQERVIASNTADTLYIADPWSVEPDARSYFALAESAWRSGCTGTDSPLSFDLPERVGTGVQLLVRSAAADGSECDPDVAPLTRWVIGQSGGLSSDNDVPPVPLFGLSVAPGKPGALEISQIAFGDLKNTRGITSGTFRFLYFDEVDGTMAPLSADLDAGSVNSSLMPGLVAGAWLQIEQEILCVSGLNPDGTYQLLRGAEGSLAAAHASTTNCLLLKEQLLVVPFVRGFFGSPASGSWSYLVDLPNSRLSSAALFVTNNFGDSPTSSNLYTRTRDQGLRTLSGGQFCFQIAGFLAAQSGAAPDIFVDRNRSVGRIYATLRNPPTGGTVSLAVRRNDQPYGAMTFEAGDNVSSSVDGLTLQSLRSGDKLSLDVTGTGLNNPGSDLTVVVAL